MNAQHHHLCEACLSVKGSNLDPIAKDCGQLQEHTLGWCFYCYRAVKRLTPDQLPAFISTMNTLGPGMSYAELETFTRTYGT